uniref:Uncharacterized protein n=1 Tax=Anguilla anguilla TaxID=7936 RepID=A0A0E9XCU5_ANGAN
MQLVMLLPGSHTVQSTVQFVSLLYYGNARSAPMTRKVFLNTLEVFFFAYEASYSCCQMFFMKIILYLRNMFLPFAVSICADPHHVHCFSLIVNPLFSHSGSQTWSRVCLFLF